MKFGRVLDRALQLGYDDGRHRSPRAGRRRLPHGRAIARGADPAKDQSYVLYMLGADQLGRIAAAGRRDDEGRGAGAGRTSSACAPRPSTRAWTCASSRAADGDAFLGDRIDRRPGRDRRRRRRRVSARHDGIDALHDRSAARHGRRAGRAALRRRHRAGDGDGDARATRAPCCATACSSRDLAFVRRPAGEVLAQTRAHGAPFAGPARGRHARVRASRSRVSRPARWSRATTATCCSAAGSPPRERAVATARSPDERGCRCSTT